ncbi:hypothetical protein LTR41_002129 [Exophiala xenobiotica]|nr:hypothetical protein LTR41_002129 [Exophiala xenobiotica]
MVEPNSSAYGPYLSRVKSLQDAYPALSQLFFKFSEFRDKGRKVVDATYRDEYGILPGRCAVLEFKDGNVSHERFDLPKDLRLHFETIKNSKHEADACRLYILKDLEPEFIELLGDRIGVDPLVFAEQTNAWYFTDVQSVGHRQLPSLNRPEKSFTLRYHELRKLDFDCRHDLSDLRSQMTFAINRRYYEPWLVVESPSMPTEDSVGVVRRCASFWTSQRKEDAPGSGWNAVLLIDPPMNVARAKRNDGKWVDQDESLPNYIFSGEDFSSRGEMWEARDYDVVFKLGKKPHASEPYHKGCPTLYPLSFSSPERLKIADMIAKEDHRDMDSLFDETVFYWKNLATTEEVRSVRRNSMNSAYHLLKHIGCHWTNVLELISHTLAQSEYFSDDNPATRPKHMSTAEWRREFYNVVEASHKINYFRRKMIYFEANMALNLERLGTSLDCDLQIDDAQKLPRALSDAQRDFKVLASRLRPLRERANNLSTVAKDIASLRAAFQAIEDGANGLSLSILAMVIFPFTLVASMFSMADNFKPGNSQFWLFFAVSIPLSAVIILFLMLNQNWEYWRNYGARTLHSIIERKDSRAKDKDGAQMKSMELPL